MTENEMENENEYNLFLVYFIEDCPPPAGTFMFV